MWFLNANKTQMPDPASALRGRSEAIPTAERHFVNNAPLKGPYPEGSQIADFGLGCFWGAEKLFWQTPGVIVTAAGYQGGTTPNPTYQEVCSAKTGQAEVVRVVFDPSVVTYEELLRTFWENHDPTQGMGQGNDVGTQYRSAIYTHSDAQQAASEASRDVYQRELIEAGYGQIMTEIRPAPEFYFAEDYHQQYLAKNVNGYNPAHDTGVACPIGGTGVRVGEPVDKVEQV